QHQSKKSMTADIFYDFQRIISLRYFFHWSFLSNGSFLKTAFLDFFLFLHNRFVLIQLFLYELYSFASKIILHIADDLCPYSCSIVVRSQPEAIYAAGIQMAGRKSGGKDRLGK